MTEPLVLNSIERLGRALFATLAPATGVRATGAVIATSSGAEVEIPKNTYLVPIVGGRLRDDLLYKTTESFTLLAGATESGIPITSNVGGARHNLPAATVFRFDPLVDGVEPTATLDANMVGGSDDGQLIRSVAFYEDLESANPSKDLFDAKVGEAGVMLVWTQSEPVEGSMGGLRQGSSRATRAGRFWREHFALYVVASRLAGDSNRRHSGHTIMQAVTRLLTDRHRNDDGEQLSTVGAGVEITHRARLGRNERTYLYGLQLRMNQTLEPVLDGRTFERWAQTHYQGALPGATDPEPTEPLDIVDAIDEMPTDSGGGAEPSYWQNDDYAFSDALAAGLSDPGAGHLTFDAVFPEGGTPINPSFAPETAYISRTDLVASEQDPFDFTGIDATALTLLVSWGLGSSVRFTVGTIAEETTFIRLHGLVFLAGEIALGETLTDETPLGIRFERAGAP